MRPSVDTYFMAMAYLVATRSTCARRSVGCVLVDARNRVLATGYNGVPRGVTHCNEGQPCAGAGYPSGVAVDLCMAIHAEQNAVIQCHDADAVVVAYCTTRPCVSCQKLLLNTGCREIMFAEDYADPSRIFEASGRVMTKYEGNSYVSIVGKWW